MKIKEKSSEHVFKCPTLVGGIGDAIRDVAKIKNIADVQVHVCVKDPNVLML